MSGSICLNSAVPVMWRALHGSNLIGEAMKTRLPALILTIMLGVVSLAGCGGATRSEPSLEDVSSRFAAMNKYDLTGDGGKVTISAKKQGTVYLLAMRSDLRKVDARRCTVDGKTMRSSSSNLNYPAGQGEELLCLCRVFDRRWQSPARLHPERGDKVAGPVRTGFLMDTTCPLIWHGSSETGSESGRRCHVRPYCHQMPYAPWSRMSAICGATARG